MFELTPTQDESVTPTKDVGWSGLRHRVAGALFLFLFVDELVEGIQDGTIVQFICLPKEGALGKDALIEVGGAIPRSRVP